MLQKGQRVKITDPAAGYYGAVGTVESVDDVGISVHVGNNSRGGKNVTLVASAEPSDEIAVAEFQAICDDSKSWAEAVERVEKRRKEIQAEQWALLRNANTGA